VDIEELTTLDVREIDAEAIKSAQEGPVLTEDHDDDAASSPLPEGQTP